jgi:hypothetical protein
MTKVKLLSAALIASAALASPALAARSSVSRYSTAGAYASACIRAPRVGAYATAPWTDEAPCEPSTSF